MADVAEKPTETTVEKKESTVEKAEPAVEAEKKTENGTGEKKTADEKENGTGEKKTADETENDAGEKKTADDADADAEDLEKSDDAESDLTKLESAIIRQVEYYFGDANLNRDKFLLEQIKKDDEGWVPFSVLVTFKRLAALSSDIDVIVDALLKSEEGLVEISEDRSKIRRHPERPIPEHNEEHRKEIMTRTAYVKGFPLEAQIDEVLEFFGPYAKVLNVNMRKYYDKADKKYKFKGSVFATFEKKEQTQSFIEKEGLSYKERALIRKWQEEYLNEKKEERERERALKEKKKKSKKIEERKIELPKGTVLHFEGVSGDIKRENMREAIEKFDGDVKVAYIEFRQGDKEGHIRFHDEGTAEKFLEKLDDKKLKINDEVELTLRVLGEEEETEFLAKVVEDMMKMRNNPNKRGNDKGGNRKRRYGNYNNGKGKKQKVDDD